ncbi:MAG: tetratricopeptide repeat protein [Chloroflexi bacterium]|nr:tetratricopeptide repeat protein [Chloroflexota bacterium]
MIIMRDLARRLPEWDAPVKFALALALALLILLVALGFFGPREIRVPARVGAFGLLVTLQVLFLWANRRDISPYHQAQNCFVAGDYQAARIILEGIPETSRVSVDALVLLGNCYRHLGLFEKSSAALEQSLQLKPNHHLALFSRGKLSLVLGEYASAAEMISRALRAGAPGIVRFELGQAHMLSGERERALSQFRAVETELADDPALTLAIRHYLNRLGERERPSAELTRAGISHWREEATKYETTPYGEEVRLLLDELENGLMDD